MSNLSFRTFAKNTANTMGVRLRSYTYIDAKGVVRKAHQADDVVSVLLTKKSNKFTRQDCERAIRVIFPE